MRSDSDTRKSSTRMDNYARYEPISSHQYSLRVSHAARAIASLFLIASDLSVGIFAIAIGAAATRMSDSSSCLPSALQRLFLSLGVTHLLSASVGAVFLVLAVLELARLWQHSGGALGSWGAWVRVALSLVSLSLLSCATGMLSISTCPAEIHNLTRVFVPVAWTLFALHLIVMVLGIALYVLLVWKKGGMEDVWKLL